MSKTKVYIVDDHKIVIDGISSYFTGNDEFELIGYANSANDLFIDMKNMIPDILLLDIKLPGLSGLNIAKIITEDYPDIKIVFLTSNIDKESLNEAVISGGRGYFTKDVTREEFFEGLEKIMKGENYYSRGIHPVLFGDFTKHIKNISSKNTDGLSEREIEVIRWISEGLSMKEIGEKMFISPRTVESHKNKILGKLGLNSTIELVKYAIKNGITSL